MVPVFPSPYLISTCNGKTFRECRPPPPFVLRTVDSTDPPRAMLHFLLRLNITARSKQLSAQNSWTIAELFDRCFYTMVLTT